jgi:type VI secretion system protein ImpA
MAEPIELDFDALLAPIPGDDPAGGSFPFEIRAKMDEARKDIDPAEWPEDDPMRPKEARKADWRSIIRLSQQTLTRSSKDLQVAARLTEALTKEVGFAGLRDGLRLMREMLEQCWDRLSPPLEDGDLEVRAAPFYWLADVDKGARFPTSILKVPLVWRDDSGHRIEYARCHWEASSPDPRNAFSPEDRDRAVREMSLEDCAAVGKAIGECLETMDQLSASLVSRLGRTAPDLSPIRVAVTSCQAVMQEILEKKRPLAVANSDNSAEQDGSGVAMNGPARAPSTRAQVYRQLKQAADVLRELEPHSPIPYFIERAVELGGLPFPDMIRSLIRDASVLSELNRELGIKEPPPPE